MPQIRINLKNLKLQIRIQLYTYHKQNATVGGSGFAVLISGHGHRGSGESATQSWTFLICFNGVTVRVLERVLV